ncbi:PRC and DUF2382 domain-containing protein [Nocardioides sp. W7]|uniref:DUF2382 domain-containing protein n=1 Tax=Nocardioides sp. W7 TaxID=2931390 RepID=UPI001FD4EB66|nr:PRC and DUF2382 domain-containing protein [Nocardioides sp. W7]
MITETQSRDIVGSTAYDVDGNKIGKVGQLFLDDQTGRPEFITVNTGFFGTSESFVPVSDAELVGSDLKVPFSKDKVKDAPTVDLDSGHLDQGDEERLYAYYGLGTQTTGTQTTGTYDDVASPGVASGGHDTSGPETDAALTRSEEHLEVGTSEREAGRARLRKYVTTETETRTVPVTKEHAVVEREPITDANRGDALDGPEISEEEHEVVLHEEKVVAQKVTEPVERVRLGTETTVDEETVSEDVRKEQIEVEGDVQDRRP